MSSVSTSGGRRKRQLSADIRASLREATAQVSLLGHHVSDHLDIRDVDFECLDLVGRHGPLTPSALARLAGLHPATVTGILDRLEKGGWLVRERDQADRRAVRVRAVPERGAQILGLYAGMNGSMAEIISTYDEGQLEVIADFLERTAEAGRRAIDEIAAKSK
jgi:DNA-binding MarR family transcriptional regulator